MRGSLALCTRVAGRRMCGRSGHRPGAVAVQIVYSYHHRSRKIEHIGSAHDDAEVELLKAVARQRLAAGQGVTGSGPGFRGGGGAPLPITSSRMGCLLDGLACGYEGLGAGDGRGRAVPRPGAGADHRGGQQAGHAAAPGAISVRTVRTK